MFSVHALWRVCSAGKAQGPQPRSFSALKDCAGQCGGEPGSLASEPRTGWCFGLVFFHRGVLVEAGWLTLISAGWLQRPHGMPGIKPGLPCAGQAPYLLDYRSGPWVAIFSVHFTSFLLGKASTSITCSPSKYNA